MEKYTKINEFTELGVREDRADEQQPLITRQYRVASNPRSRKNSSSGIMIACFTQEYIGHVESEGGEGLL